MINLVSSKRIEQYEKRIATLESQILRLHADKLREIDTVRAMAEIQVETLKEQIKDMKVLNERLLRQAGLDPLDTPASVETADQEQENRSLETPKSPSARAIRRTMDNVAAQRNQAEIMRREMQQRASGIDTGQGNGESA